MSLLPHLAVPLKYPILDQDGKLRMVDGIDLAMESRGERRTPAEIYVETVLATMKRELLRPTGRARTACELPRVTP
jgi:hypothetical protein